MRLLPQRCGTDEMPTSVADVLESDALLAWVRKHEMWGAIGGLMGSITTGVVACIVLGQAIAVGGTAVAVVGSILIGGALAAISVFMAFIFCLTIGQDEFGEIPRMPDLGSCVQWCVRRALEAADKREGWRPRTGALHPRGRDDVHDRFVVEVVPEPTGFEVGVQHWSYDAEEGWQPQEGLQLARSFDDDEEGLHALALYRGVLDEYAATVEGRTHEAHVAQEAEQQLIAERLAANTHLAKKLNKRAVI